MMGIGHARLASLPLPVVPASAQTTCSEKEGRGPSGLESNRGANEDICILMSDYLLDTAEKFMIEVPSPKPPEWTHSDRNSRVYLTETSMFKLRSAIRAERKERSELARSWLSSITGLIGVLIGLLAIILGRR
jgi:hypothetical protein